MFMIFWTRIFHFPFYQDSYHVLMTKELAEVIREDAEKLAQKTGIKL